MCFNECLQSICNLTLKVRTVYSILCTKWKKWIDRKRSFDKLTMIEPVKERDIVNYKESKENNWKKYLSIQILIFNKRKRAFGGYLHIGRRRRTYYTAISHGERWISVIHGFPNGETRNFCYMYNVGCTGERRELKHLSTCRKGKKHRKVNTLWVVVSESGRGTVYLLLNMQEQFGKVDYRGWKSRIGNINNKAG